VYTFLSVVANSKHLYRSGQDEAEGVAMQGILAESPLAQIGEYSASIYDGTLPHLQ
jgi:hypothetical protein